MSGNELEVLLRDISRKIPDARTGLPDEVFQFVSQHTPLINVDLLIKNSEGKTLLTWRDDQFYGPAWHIPGGIIRFKEKIETRIAKVAEQELGCVVKFESAPINVAELMNQHRDTRGHFISLLFRCALISNPDPARACQNSTPTHGQWAWHDGAPSNLLLVHEPFRKFMNNV